LTCDDAGSAVADASDANAPDATIQDAGDAAAALLGRPGAGLVSGGTACASPKYRMVVSLGQGPGGNAASASPKYRLKGGVVGASQAP
jgi:hypothetical protein